jgi:hypothetical protein
VADTTHDRPTSLRRSRTALGAAIILTDCTNAVDGSSHTSWQIQLLEWH